MFTEAQKKTARRLRRNATEAEKMLWRRLRDRQLDGLKFRRQFPIGRYVADFVCQEIRLVVELDGGQHSTASDAARSAFLTSEGWHILRFWNNEVMSNTEGVLRAIQEKVSKIS